MLLPAVQTALEASESLPHESVMNIFGRVMLDTPAQSRGCILDAFPLSQPDILAIAERMSGTPICVFHFDSPSTCMGEHGMADGTTQEQVHMWLWFCDCATSHTSTNLRTSLPCVCALVTLGLLPYEMPTCPHVIHEWEEGLVAQLCCLLTSQIYSQTTAGCSVGPLYARVCIPVPIACICLPACLAGDSRACFAGGQSSLPCW